MKEFIKGLFWPKPKRTVKVVLAHKFKNGKKIFTYHEKDWELVMYMHEYTIQQIMNYHMIFQNDKNTVDNTISKIMELLQATLNGGKVQETIPKAMSLVNFLTIANKESLSARDQLRAAMFNMYFILEHEPEFTFSDVYLEAKLKLLDAEPEVKARFFTMLNPIIDNIIESYSKSILAVSKDLKLSDSGKEVNMNIEDF